MSVTSRNSGFTLLEIMVSTAILAVALLAIMSMQANTLLTSRRAEDLTVATMLARREMMEVELELQKGQRRGEFPDEKSESGNFEEPYADYRWRYEIKRVELPAPMVGEEGSIQATVGAQLTQEISKSVRELKLTVAWDEGGEEQTIDIVTHLVKM